MAKIVLLNYVHIDGWGDIKHFFDIYLAMRKNDRLKNNEYISFLCAPLRTREEVEDKISRFNSSQPSDQTKLQSYYIVPYDDDNFHENVEVQQHFAECEQVLVISCISRTFPNFENFLSYCKPGVIVKYVGEHEHYETFTGDIRKITTKSGEKIQNPISIYAMGLSKKNHARGIKLDISPSNENPWETINKNDAQFFETLLAETKSINREHFVETNFFIPCYFNKMLPFLRFLLLLAINDSLSEKNIVLFFSGQSEQMCQDVDDILRSSTSKFFITSHIKKIRLIGKDSQHDISVKPEGTKIIYIFHDFHISDESYRAIYKTKPLLAAISGDNTLELTIANKILPFYVSTNFLSKKYTNMALFDIAKELSTNNDKSDLLGYLDFDKFQRFVSFRDVSDLIIEFKNLNLIAAAKQWQDVAAHIIVHLNLYDVLENVFYDKLPKTEEKKQAQAIQMWNKSVKQVEDKSNNNNNDNNNNNTNKDRSSAAEFLK